LSVLPSALLHSLDKTAVEAERCRRSFRLFIERAWSVIEPHTTFIPGWHIDCIADHLEAVARGDIRDLLINIPPRHMKSLAVAVFWPAWLWTQRPGTRFLCASYSLHLSTRDSVRCRRLVSSEWYQGRWGDVVELVEDQNQKIRFETSAGGYRIATSVGGTVTGEGGDFIIVDDPHNIEEVESEALREMVLRWWDEVMSTRLNDPKRGGRVIVMQRVHERDLTGHLLERGGWHHLCLPARYEPKVTVMPGQVEIQPHHECPYGSDPRTQDGELLWPERFGEEEIKRLEIDLGPFGTAGQLQQRPVPREGAYFRAEWFGQNPPDVADRIVRKVQYWDLAYSQRTGADFTVAVTLGIDGDQRLYILHVLRQRIEAEGLVDLMARHIEDTRPDLVGVEEGAYKQAAVRDIVRLLTFRLTHPAAVLPVPVSRDKVTRALLAASRAQHGFLFADKAAPWWGDFLTELLRFPKGAHDDQVDALAGAVQLAVEKVPVALHRRRTRQRYRLGHPARPEMDAWWSPDTDVVVVRR